ncbi:hypothetical protein BDZ97DRAFT_1766101 [Flammula alnicola]|nr:hypothetical protein BDZ97DRAFT_1766101 [Flammula alnicola]
MHALFEWGNRQDSPIAYPHTGKEPISGLPPWWPAAISAKAQYQLQANHTSVASLFKRMLDQYDRLKKCNAFMEQYKKGNVFLRTAWKSSMLHDDPIRSDSRIEIDAKIAAGYFRNVTELDLAKAVDLFFKRPQLVRRKEVLEDGTVVHASYQTSVICLVLEKKVEQKMSVGQSHESLYGGINLAQFEI